eukprot:CAMPEP_0202840750 /NCGR_PEP_ID=MMETSP1389-20130828/56616_1 /ASSEMBLY_ACC=CAM_ASM_000865 /TAXON_ID=302021 /ORGANISM="Rhodomonas sp., Strain CCMP768" /LENGTH=37 /DNA_ID= /DNA_START= /DNA_END= /DNA_ORIENTATION=
MILLDTTHELKAAWYPSRLVSGVTMVCSAISSLRLDV